MFGMALFLGLGFPPWLLLNETLVATGKHFPMLTIEYVMLHEIYIYVKERKEAYTERRSHKMTRVRGKGRAGGKRERVRFTCSWHRLLVCCMVPFGMEFCKI